MKKQSLISPVFSLRSKMIRAIWVIVWNVFIRWSPVFLYKYRVIIFRLFGADISIHSRIYPSARVWFPGNLKIGVFSTLGPHSNLYNQGHIEVGDYVIISQGAHICASTHDYNDPLHPLILKPIKIDNNTWICADAFVGPGVNVAEGTVVGARAAVFKDTEAWSVYSGNPARLIKTREKF
jgi:putative colanic acid biosynthesis acetyltransferase WcaF